MEIKPFRGIFYNQSKVELENVVTPPYDVISLVDQDEYYEKSEFNVIRLDLNKEKDTDTKDNNRYTRAAAHFNEWLKKEILRKTGKPAIFLYEQVFKVSDKQYSRQGFIVLARVFDFEDGKILPHERTLLKAQEDRLNLIKATKANFSNIFGLYADEEKRIEKILKNCQIKKLAEVEFQGTLNRISAIDDPADIKKIQNSFDDHLIYIADGHHRYKISLMYRNLMRVKNPSAGFDAPWEFVMINLVNTYSEGLVILPTHRLVKVDISSKNIHKRLSERFLIDEKNTVEELLNSLQNSNGKRALGAYYSEKYFLLVLKDDSFLNDIPSADIDVIRNLDVTLLHEVALYKCLGLEIDAPEKGLVKFVVDPHDAVLRVDNDYSVVFFLNATKIGQVRAVAEQGQTMPQKSTYFYPKLLTGLIMRELGD